MPENPFEAIYGRPLTAADIMALMPFEPMGPVPAPAEPPLSDMGPIPGQPWPAGDIGAELGTVGGGLAAMGASALDPFGIPSYFLGQLNPELRDAWRETYETAPVPAMAGAAVAPLALPRTVGTAGKAVAGGLAGLWGLLGESTPLNSQDAATAAPKGAPRRPATNEELTAEAERNQDPLWRKIQSHPDLVAKYQRMQEARREARQPVKGVNKESADAIRTKAQGEAERLLGEITQALNERHPPKQSFEDAYPAIARNMPFLQPAVGAAAGLALKGGEKVAKHLLMSPWRQAIRQGEDALDPGLMSRILGRRGPNLPRAENAATVADEYAAASRAPSRAGSMAQAGFDNVMIPAAGAAAGAEAALLHHNYNLRNAPEDSPEYAKAKEALSNENFWTTLGKAAILPGLSAWGAAHLVPIPGAKPPLERTAALRKNVDRAKAEAQVPAGGSQTAPALSGQTGHAPAPQHAAPTPPPGGQAVGPTPEGQAAGRPGRPAPRTYSRYTSIPESMRTRIQDAYLAKRALEGRDLPAEATARELRKPFTRRGVDIRGLNAKRVQETNRAYNDFVNREGRSPSRADRDNLFNDRTLSIGAVAGGAAATAVPDQSRDERLKNLEIAREARGVYADHFAKAAADPAVQETIDQAVRAGLHTRRSERAALKELIADRYGYQLSNYRLAQLIARSERAAAESSRGQREQEIDAAVRELVSPSENRPRSPGERMSETKRVRDALIERFPDMTPAEAMRRANAALRRDQASLR